MNGYNIIKPTDLMRAIVREGSGVKAVPGPVTNYILPHDIKPICYEKFNDSVKETITYATIYHEPIRFYFKGGAIKGFRFTYGNLDFIFVPSMSKYLMKEPRK